ncbi:vascular cell adhesion protein 1b isoform X2 [Narcine bancroftii]|uniref:vascular cell adhesion protein 1b isoform X2 n=1 Tax=Narcine bancroftii TaxID=1343680 RepID=UPI003831B43A
MTTRSCVAAALTFLLTTGYALELELNPVGDVWHRIGETLVLSCRAKNCASPSFRWQVGTDNPLAGTVSHGVSESTLTFAPVTVQNEHRYMCIAKCGAEEKEKIVTLHVYALSDALILETMGSLEVGRKGTVRCTVPSIYPVDVKVEWLNATTLLKEDTIYRHTEKEKAWNFTYELTPDLADSVQELTCRVHLFPDQRFMSEATEKFQVHYPPRMITVSPEPSFTVEEGQNVSLTCVGDGSPAASMTWRKLSAGNWSVLAEDEAVLHLSPALTEDAGIYRCEASNHLGQKTKEVEVHVQGRPRDITFSFTPSAVQEGDHVTVSYTTHSGSPAKLVLRGLTSSGWIDLDPENGTLTTSAVMVDDSGLINVQEKEPDIVKSPESPIGILEITCTGAVLGSVKKI